MSRRLRTRCLTTKTNPETSPAAKNVAKSSRGRGGDKQNEETKPKRASALRDKTNISDEMSKSTEKDSLSREKGSVELTESGKRSGRLKTEKSRGVNERDSLSGRDETQKGKSVKIQKRTRLRSRNESQENDFDDGEAKPDPKKTQNKFFKSKKAGADGQPAIIHGQRKNGVKTGRKIAKTRESLGYAVSLRQTTLSESFGRGSLRARLRPRKTAKDYKDSSSISVLVEKSISPEKRRSLILLERIDGAKTGREPIYKAVSKLGDKSNEDKDSIYDFQFDLNDPDEKPARSKTGRKKATRKATGLTRRKKKTAPLLKSSNNEETKPAEKVKAPSGDEVIDKKLEPLPVQSQNAEETESGKVAERQEAPVSPQDPIMTEILEDKAPRARICSVETLTGDRKVSFKPNLSLSRHSSAKFNPFRSTQSIFRPRSTMHAKDMMDHSLLNKSLSPIKGDVETFDPASPWRPPVPNSFSSVRRIVQSTPQAKRSFARTAVGFKIDENDENEENAGAKAAPLAKVAQNRAPNPLGVRISNEENIQASHSRKNEPILPREDIPKLSKPVMARKPLGLASGYAENKQNSGFGDRLYVSPKKNEIGSPGMKKRNNPLPSRGEVAENLAPQKMDSVVEDEENSPPMEETKLLKQSNLNVFLNLDEMPESIRINTSHGIFGDENSTISIVKTSQAQKIPAQPNVENCFGFDDDSFSDVQESPKKSEKKQPEAVKRMFQRLKGRVLSKEKVGAARISLGEIKNTLYPTKERQFEKIESGEEKNGKKKDADLGDDPRNKKSSPKLKEISNPVQFSDTFDVLSESGKAEDDGKSIGHEFELFADLEPVHFTKPPRWSYAKKRDRKEYWSSGEEDDNEEVGNLKEPVLKKRRLVKLNKVEEKKIDEWVKSVNETFQEIDDFDLVVEKLS